MPPLQIQVDLNIIMKETEYNDRLGELKEILTDAIVRNLEETAPYSEVEAAQTAYNEHVANRDILITEYDAEYNED